MFIFAKGGWVKKFVVFCGRRNCMTPNVKKVIFLALVPVLHRKSYPHFRVYVHSKWKVTNIFNFQEWHQNAQLQIFIQANITAEKILKTCQKRPHLLSSRFIKLFYKCFTTTWPRQSLLSGPKSGRLGQVWLYLLFLVLYLVSTLFVEAW